jgi:hypothetical protein
MGNANAKTDVSLKDGAPFKFSGSGSVTVNTGLSNTKSIMIGASCGTVFGYYIRTLMLSSTDNLAGAPTFSIWLSKNTGNVNLSVKYHPADTSSITTVSLAKGGFIRTYFYSPDWAVDDVIINITTPTGQTNDTTFKVRQGNTITLKAESMTVAFDTEITSTTATADQIISVASANKCFSFSNDFKLTFKLDGTLATLPDAATFKAKFAYTNPDNRKPDEIYVTYKAPIAFTTLYCELTCDGSDPNTAANLQKIMPYTVSANPSLVSYYVAAFTDATSTADVLMKFSKLQRATTFTLHCVIANNQIGGTVVETTITSFVNSADANAPFLLQTLPTVPAQYLQIIFSKDQSAATKNAIVRYLQLLYPSFSVQADGVSSLNGYEYVPAKTCAKDSATNDFVVVDNSTTASTATTATTATSTARLLQATTTTTTTTATAATDTTSATQTPTSYTFNIVFKQNSSSDEVINIDTFKTAVGALTVDTLNAALAASERVDGTFSITIAQDTVINEAEIKGSAGKYANSAVTFSAIAGQQLKCLALVRKYTESDKANNALKNQPACDPATNTKCAEITLSPTSSTKTIATGPLEAGTWQVDLKCQNIIFQPVNVGFASVTIETIPDATSSSTSVVDKTCPVNSKLDKFPNGTQYCNCTIGTLQTYPNSTEYCSSSIISLTTILFAMIMFFLFDL